MICYKDKTFCPYWQLCKIGYKCELALTEKVKQDAAKWWGGDNAPIAVYKGFPPCFITWFEEVK